MRPAVLFGGEKRSGREGPPGGPGGPFPVQGGARHDGSHRARARRTGRRCAAPGRPRPSSAAVPRLADGVELLGEYQNSGYRQPPSLVRRADGQVIQMSPLLYRVTCRIDGSRDAAAIAELVTGDLGRTLTADQVRHVIAAKLIPLGIVARPGRPRRRADGQPTARPPGPGHAAARARGERGRNAAPAAVPPAPGHCRHRQRAGPGLLAVRHPRPGRRAGAGAARPGGPARGGRPDRDLGRVPRVRARDRLPLRRRAARPDRRRHLPDLAVVLHQRHRLVPAQPRRAAAHRPWRPLLQPGLHAGAGRHLRGHLGPGPAPGHRHHPPGDAGAAAPVRPVRWLLHPQRPGRRAGPVRPGRPHPARRRWRRARGTHGSPASAAAPGSS